MTRLHAHDLAPFRAAIGSGLGAVMVGHLLVRAVDPRNPATLSPAVVGGLLRDRMGFDGLVVSDALEMGALAGTLSLPAAAERALAAGVDQLVLSGHTAVPAVLDHLGRGVAAGRLRRGGSARPSDGSCASSRSPAGPCRPAADRRQPTAVLAAAVLNLFDALLPLTATPRAAGLTPSSARSWRWRPSTRSAWASCSPPPSSASSA